MVLIIAPRFPLRLNEAHACWKTTMEDYRKDGRHYYIYILRCCNDFYYVGQTAHLVQRMWQHFVGKGARFTSRNPPCELMHLEVRYTREEALERESELIRIVNRKKFIFDLPNEFEEFFYRIASMAINNTWQCLDDCEFMVDVPIVKSWGRSKYVYRPRTHGDYKD